MNRQAYDETYLDYAQKNLGEAFTYASICCGIDMDSFMGRFLVSRLAEEFGRGNPKYVVGLSGTELAMEVLERTGFREDFPPVFRTELSLPEQYWCGWILALYQWYSGRSFREIHAALPMQDILQAYPAMHQSPEEKFLEMAETRLAEWSNTNKLQQQRRLMAYSQRILAERSGVNLRTLQQYESGAKDLHKASYDTVKALADALCCTPEAILP